MCHFRVNVPFYVSFLCQGKYLQRIDLGCMLVYRSILAAKRKVVKDLIEISEKIENVRLSDDGTKVIILDQEKLPNAEEYLELDNASGNRYLCRIWDLCAGETDRHRGF